MIILLVFGPLKVMIVYNLSVERMSEVREGMDNFRQPLEKIGSSKLRTLLACWPLLCYTFWCWEERESNWEQRRHKEDHMPRVPLHALIWSSDQNLYECYTQGQLEQRFHDD